MVFKAVTDDEARRAQPAKPAAKPQPQPEPQDDYDDEEDEEEPAPRHRKSGGGRKAVIIIAIVLAVLCVAAVAGGFAVRSSDKIFPNVSVNGVGVGSMTVSQAQQALGSADTGDTQDAAVSVILPAGCRITVDAAKAGASQSAEEAAAAAYKYGRDGNPVSSLITYFKCLFSSGSVTASAAELDEDYIKEQIKSGVSDMNEALSGDSYNLDTDKAVLSVVKGADSIQVDEDEVYKLIADALINHNYDEIEYQYKTSETAASFDMDELHDKVYAEAKNASYDTATGEVTESVVGVDFDVDEAKTLWDKAAVGDTVEIPIEVTQPKVTTDDLSSKLFKDKLGSQVSYFKSSSSNRINNLTLAAEKINGTILNPGDEFSYNGTVGQRTEAAGFKKAGAYANGEVVQEIGGGICQVSSTLYCAVLYANLEVTDRTCHYFPVDYLPSGLDATVSWKSPDFKFKNNRDYPIKLVATVDKTKKSLTVEIMGTNVDGSYVQLKSSTWKYYDSKYTSVALGVKTTTYRNVYSKDGTLISSTKEATSTYHYHTENIVYPSAKPSATPSATAKPTATPAAETPAATKPVEATPTPATTEETTSGYTPQ